MLNTNNNDNAKWIGIEFAYEISAVQIITPYTCVVLYFLHNSCLMKSTFILKFTTSIQLKISRIITGGANE